MPTITIELDDICSHQQPPDERDQSQPRIWHPTWMKIGLDTPGFFNLPGSPDGILSRTGSLVFDKLRAMGLAIWFPDVPDVRQSGKMLAQLDLAPEHGVGFGPPLDRLMRRIARQLAQCGLGECRIEYVVSDKTHSAQAPWPIGYCDASNWPKSTFAV